MADNFVQKPTRRGSGKSSGLGANSDLYALPSPVINNDIQWKTMKTLRLNFQTFGGICRRCCCKPNMKQRLRIKAYEQTLKEVSISHIIRQIRVLNTAAKDKMTPE